MRESVTRPTKFILLAIFLTLFLRPTVVADITGSFLDPITEESVQWTLMYMGQHVGPDHLYGNFMIGVTFDAPPSLVIFWISNEEMIDEVSHEVWYILMNKTSAPYECNFSTLDYSVGEHEITRYVKETNTSPYVGGGTTYFFEHQDRSGDQYLYTGATIGISALSIAGIFAIGFSFYKLYERSSKTRQSRFERVAIVLDSRKRLQY